MLIRFKFEGISLEQVTCWHRIGCWLIAKCAAWPFKVSLLNTFKISSLLKISSSFTIFCRFKEKDFSVLKVSVEPFRSNGGFDSNQQVASYLLCCLNVCSMNTVQWTVFMLNQSVRTPTSEQYAMHIMHLRNVCFYPKRFFDNSSIDD